MLADDGAGIDGYDFAVGEGDGQSVYGCLVVDGLIVCGTKHGTVQHEEIGVSRGQAFSFVKDDIGHGKWEESVRLALDGGKGA